MLSSRRAVAGTFKAVALLVALASYAGARDARAAEGIQVATGRERGPGHLALQFSVGWSREHRSSSVERERVVAGGAVAVGPDLVSRHTRQTLTLRADAGVVRGLGVFVAAPLILSDDRTLDFAGGVQPAGATILRDRILPGGTSAFGLDAEKNRPFLAGSDAVFRGPSRQGLEYLAVGARWAVLTQERDDTKPNWVVGLESRLSIAGEMRFDPARPTANRAVGLGYHQIMPSTAFSTRFGWLEPFVAFAYMFPVATGDGAFADAKLGKNAFARPQQRVTTAAGFEALAWEDPRSAQRIAVELRGHVELRMQGLARSELWEPLSGSSRCPLMPSACRPDVDRDVDADGVVDRHPGLTRSPAYGVFGGELVLSARVGELVRFRALLGLTYEQSRFLTDGGSGNVIHDLPGRRFHIDDARAYSVSVDSSLVF